MQPMKPRSSDLHGAAPDRSRTALLILDMFSDFEFEDGPAVLKAATPVTGRIARLKARARAARIPVLYVNDNNLVSDRNGRWRSDFPALVRRCSRLESRGSAIARLLLPDEKDYCVLKPKHSGFFSTPLDSLLQAIGARTLILTGVSSHQCILFTANDAYVRDFELAIPRDCIAAPSRADMRLALQYFTRVLGAKTTPSTALRLHHRSRSRARSISS